MCCTTYQLQVKQAVLHHDTREAPSSMQPRDVTTDTCCALSLLAISLSAKCYLIVFHRRTERSGVRLDKQLVSPPVKFPTFYGTSSFIMVSACPCPASDQSSPCPPCFSNVHFNVILHPCPWPSKPSLSPPKALLTHTCYMPAHLFLLVSVIRIIFAEEYES